MKKLLCFSLLAITVCGCLNMTTDESRITGSYVSTLRYEEYSCQKLAVEMESLVRRENALKIAQQQRKKQSSMQSFFWGFGKGDGIEAAELATVRGEIEAVRTALGKNGCL